MNQLISHIAHHGYVIICGIVFAEAIGLPVPAALALVAGGAAVAAGKLNAPHLVLLTLLAMLAGDVLLYFLGKQMGWSLLGFLCKLSVNPESCILRSAESFYKRGKITLVLAKFLPGVNTMAPPLAGSMRMRFLQFLRFDLAGASLYLFTYGTIGFISRDFLAALGRGFQTAGRAIETVLLLAFAAYVIYRFWLYRKNSVYRVVPRVQVEELTRLLSSTEGRDKVLIVDVRSHGYYDGDAERILGSIRLEPNHLSDEAKALPKDKDIYLYCT
jgi:membrane protein DedA with SNARE-associated domain